MLDNLPARLDDLQKLKLDFAFLVTPSMVNVVNGDCPVPEPLVPESSAVEMELMEFQEDPDLNMIHKFKSTIEFWKQVPEIKYPELKKTSVWFFTIFSTTHCYESLNSVMKFVKRKSRVILTHTPTPDGVVRTALTTYQPDCKRLTAKLETRKTTTSSK